MLDYFRNIGFPCPELENPLMYYRKQQKLNIFKTDLQNSAYNKYRIYFII